MPIWCVKLCAGALVIFATSASGFAVAKRLRDRPRQLQTLQSVLQGLATEIAYGATPLPEALRHIGLATDGAIADFLLAAAETLQAPGVTAAEAWQSGLAHLRQGSALQPGDLAILGQLGNLLGLSDRHDQERHLLLAVQQLTRAEAKAEGERQASERMWRYLGVLSGVLLVIVLV